MRRNPTLIPFSGLASLTRDSNVPTKKASCTLPRMPDIGGRRCQKPPNQSRLSLGSTSSGALTSVPRCVSGTAKVDRYCRKTPSDVGIACQRIEFCTYTPLLLGIGVPGLWCFRNLTASEALAATPQNPFSTVSTQLGHCSILAPPASTKKPRFQLRARTPSRHRKSTWHLLKSRGVFSRRVR